MLVRAIHLRYTYAPYRKRDVLDSVADEVSGAEQRMMDHLAVNDRAIDDEPDQPVGIFWVPRELGVACAGSIDDADEAAIAHFVAGPVHA